MNILPYLLQLLVVKMVKHNEICSLHGISLSPSRSEMLVTVRTACWYLFIPLWTPLHNNTNKFTINLVDSPEKLWGSGENKLSTKRMRRKESYGEMLTCWMRQFNWNFVLLQFDSNSMLVAYNLSDLLSFYLSLVLCMRSYAASSTRSLLVFVV